MLGTFVGNPLTYPLFWYATYEVGNLMLGGESTSTRIDLSAGIFQSSLDQLWPILKPMSLGCDPDRARRCRRLAMSWSGRWSRLISIDAAERELRSEREALGTQ